MNGRISYWAVTSGKYSANLGGGRNPPVSRVAPNQEGRPIPSDHACDGSEQAGGELTPRALARASSSCDPLCHAPSDAPMGMGGPAAGADLPDSLDHNRLARFACGLKGRAAPAQSTGANRASRDGLVNYLAGLHAEECVALEYQRSGREIVARRWRGESGEIDVIAREGARVVFIEVKKSRTHDLAARHLTEGQMQRILRAGSEFLGGEPAGQRTEMRIDVALVDQMGRIEILENAYAA